MSYNKSMLANLSRLNVTMCANNYLNPIAIVLLCWICKDNQFPEASCGVYKVSFIRVCLFASYVLDYVPVV